MPVMVCVDGFILTHAVERIDIPEQARSMPFFRPMIQCRCSIPPSPSIGAMVGPEAFTEVRFLSHYKQTQALKLIPKFSTNLQKVFGRESGGLVRGYRSEDAEMLVVAMGSVCGTIKDTIDEMRDGGIRIGLVRSSSLPALSGRCVAQRSRRCERVVVVVEKSIAVGMGGQLANNVDVALRNLPRRRGFTPAVAGLGGRAITRASLHRLFRQAACSPGKARNFLDLNERVVGREIHRTRKNPAAGPTPKTSCGKWRNPARRRPPNEEQAMTTARQDLAPAEAGAETEILSERDLYRRQPAGGGRGAHRCKLRRTDRTR